MYGTCRIVRKYNILIDMIVDLIRNENENEL